MHNNKQSLYKRHSYLRNAKLKLITALYIRGVYTLNDVCVLLKGKEKEKEICSAWCLC